MAFHVRRSQPFGRPTARRTEEQRRPCTQPLGRPLWPPSRPCRPFAAQRPRPLRPSCHRCPGVICFSVAVSFYAPQTRPTSKSGRNEGGCSADTATIVDGTAMGLARSMPGRRSPWLRGRPQGPPLRLGTWATLFFGAPGGGPAGRLGISCPLSTRHRGHRNPVCRGQPIAHMSPHGLRSHVPAFARSLGLATIATCSPAWRVSRTTASGPSPLRWSRRIRSSGSIGEPRFLTVTLPMPRSTRS